MFRFATKSLLLHLFFSGKLSTQIAEMDKINREHYEYVSQCFSTF